MKRIFLSLLILFSLDVFAAVEMRFAPASPAVFRASTKTEDGKIVPGPYFINQFNFNSNREAVIEVLNVKATSNEGASIEYKIVLPEPLAVHPGITAHTGILYFGALPFSRIFTYRVEVLTDGHFVGNAEAFTLAGSFLTQ